MGTTPAGVLLETSAPTPALATPMVVVTAPATAAARLVTPSAIVLKEAAVVVIVLAMAAVRLDIRSVTALATPLADRPASTAARKGRFACKSGRDSH